MTMLLQIKVLNYQLSQYCFAVLVTLFSCVSAPNVALLALYGRFMFFFPQITTATNDSMAYFVGKAFGRTKLISLSPNKTWEGFLGGMFSNIFQSFFLSGLMLQSADR